MTAMRRLAEDHVRILKAGRRNRDVDPRASLAPRDSEGVGELADSSEMPCLYREFCRRRDLGPHRPRGKDLAGKRHRICASYRACARRAVVQINGVDVGQQEQQVSMELPREQRAGEILVDHRLDAGKTALPSVYDWNAPLLQRR
jgi:hypothetical protein